MLSVKNGIRSVLRSPGKTVLFFFLLLSLTAVLALGLRVYSAVSVYIGRRADNLLARVRACQIYYRIAYIYTSVFACHNKRACLFAQLV